MNNIIKYSNAREVRISLEDDLQYVLLTIKDDGIGCDPTANTEGVGLMNIRTRASIFNGDVKVISAPGEGFELHVKFLNV